MKDFLKALLFVEFLFIIVAHLHDAQAGDDCIRDGALTWYVAPGAYTWFDPKVRGTDTANNTNLFIKSLSVCSLGGWRLPTKSELESLIYCPKGKSNDWVKGYPCNKDDLSQHVKDSRFKVNGTYWTSETYQQLPDYAWYVNFSIGAVDRSFKSDRRGILAVTNLAIPKNVSCNLPTYSNSILTIPEFEKGQPVSSATVLFDFAKSTFNVLNYK